MTDIKKFKLIGIILAVIAVFAALIYFGIFWWTMLGLLIFIVVMLHFSVSVHLRASRAEGIDIRAKYLFLTIYPRGNKKPKPAAAPPAFSDDMSFELTDMDDDGFDDDDLPEPEPLTEEETPSQEDAAPAPEEQPAADDKPAEAEPPKPEDKKDDQKPEAPKEKSKGKLAALKEKFERIKPYIPIGWKAVKKFCKAIRFEGVEIQADVGRFDAHEAAIYYGAVQGALFDLLGKIAAIFTLKLKRADVICHFNENKLDGFAELTVRVRPSTLIAIAFCTAVNFLRVFLRERRKRKKAAKQESVQAAAS